MEKLFTIIDEDDNSILACYLTDNLQGCKDAMEYVDSVVYGEDRDFTIWQETFENTCMENGVKIKQVFSSDSESYWF